MCVILTPVPSVTFSIFAAEYAKKTLAKHCAVSKNNKSKVNPTLKNSTKFIRGY
jgi:hypothetical protein